MSEHQQSLWYPIYTECVRTNAAQIQYEEFSCVLQQQLAAAIINNTDASNNGGGGSSVNAYIHDIQSFLHSTYQSFELSFDPVHNRDAMIQTPYIPIVAVVLYGVFILVGQSYFAKQAAWDWRITMSCWNLLLSVFSLIGFVRTAPALYHNFITSSYGIQDNFCFDPESHFGSGSTGLWVQLFILSKFPELLDTFFIVIHKKPLIFLHWYHHISVLLYCWHSYVTKAPTGIIFCVMNYAVHAIMYFYYFLMAVKCKPKFFRAIYITSAQISQMIVGVIVTIYGCYLLWIRQVKPETCWLTPENNFAALLMYGSYLFLFLQFFWKRYDDTKTSGGTKQKKSAHTNGSSSTAAQYNQYVPKIVKED